MKIWPRLFDADSKYIYYEKILRKNLILGTFMTSEKNTISF